MGYLVYVFVVLALAILAMAVPVVHAWIHDCNVSALKIRIKSNPTASSGAIAAQKLLALSDPRAIEAARNLMLGYGENFEAARTVIASLQSTPYPQWIDLLIELSLQQENSDIRYLALGALENVRQTERTLNIFRQLFRDPDPAVARISAWVLAKAGHGEAISYLMESAIPDSEIEKVAQPIPGASVYAPAPFPDQATNGFFSSKLSDVDAFKLGMHVLRRMDEYSTEVVNDLFQMRNRGTYLAMALSLEEGVLLGSETLKNLAQMGYPQVAGRLADDLLGFGWMKELPKAVSEEDVWKAKSTLEQFLKDFGVQVPVPHLRKIANIEDFEFRTSEGSAESRTRAPLRMDLSSLRDEASILIARHTAFWDATPETTVSNTSTVLSRECCALKPATCPR